MKVLILITLVVAMLLQSLYQVGVLVNYQMNKSSITKVYCENKNMPAMHCNGKCYLAKQLSKSDQDTKKNSQRSNLQEGLNLIAQQSNSLTIQNFSKGTSFSIKENNNYSFQYSLLLDHPPSATLQG